MTVFLTVYSERVEIRLPSNPAKGVSADAVETVEEGETWNGYTYEQLQELGSGEHKIQID